MTQGDAEAAVATIEQGEAPPARDPGEIRSTRNLSRRRAIVMGGAAAITGALGAILVGCGKTSANGASSSGAAASSSAPAATPPATTPAASGSTAAPKAQATANVGLYSGPTVPASYKATLGVSASGPFGAPTAVPAGFLKNGKPDLSAYFLNANAGFLQGALSLAAWNKKHPNVTFKTYPALWSGAEGGMAPLLTQLAGGTAPDVFPAYGDNPAPYVAQNALADITEYVNAWPEWAGLPSALQGGALVNGKAYAIPSNNPYGYCITYRKDLFQAAGVTPPTPTWTTDDYLSVAQKMTNASKKIWGTNLLWQYTNWFFSELSQCLGVPTAGYWFWVPDPSGTKYDIAPVAEAARALAYYQSFVNNKSALYGSSQSLGATWQNQLVAGQVAMCITQTKTLGGLLTHLPASKVGVLPMPQGPGGTRCYDIGSNYYSINASNTGDKLTLAFQYLKDMVGPRGNELLYAMDGLQGQLPPLPPAYSGTSIPLTATSDFPTEWIDLITGPDIFHIEQPPQPSAYALPTPPSGTATGWDPYIQEAMLKPTESATAIAQKLKAHMDSAVNTTPIAGLTKTKWHAYYKALGAYFQKNYPTYYSSTYTKYYKQFETF